jgi:hypothetical protein
MHYFRFIVLILLSQGLLSCGNNSEVDACIQRGVTYFKEIGSYPTLLTEPNVGRSAESVAVERCNRTTTAF